MKELILHSKHKRAIISGQKTRTIQLGRKLAKKFKCGNRIRIGIRTNRNQKEHLVEAIILSVKVKRLGNLTKQDIAGGNPKTKTIQDLIKSLSFYYKKKLDRELRPDDVMTLIRWGHTKCL